MVGESRLSSSFVVFRQLATPMLIGVNTMTSGGLVLNHYSRQLYVDPTLAGGMDCTVPMELGAAGACQGCVEDVTFDTECCKEGKFALHFDAHDQCLLVQPQ